MGNSLVCFEISETIIIYIYIPYAPCIEYLPTYTTKMTQMQVKIPYIEHLGICINYVYNLLRNGYVANKHVLQKQQENNFRSQNMVKYFIDLDSRMSLYVYTCPVA
jgi:hypothetical protein